MKLEVNSYYFTLLLRFVIRPYTSGIERIFDELSYREKYLCILMEMFYKWSEYEL